VFYDTKIKLSSKTTFDAITNALVTTPLTDESGQRFGDTLDIIEQVDMVRGQVLDASRSTTSRSPDAIGRPTHGAIRSLGRVARPAMAQRRIGSIHSVADTSKCTR
jgi:hypothetical protein